jgi:UDP-N-acetylglucosamine--dolichyl-phosphate N-acetylglucosaminephosphotransferase
MEIALFSCFVVAFAVTLILIPKWIRKAVAMGLVGKDMNKPKRPQVAEAGGITVIVGAVAGMLVYIFIMTFYFSSTFGLIQIYAAITTILLAGIVGFIDDILGWKAGIKHSTKVLSTIPIAIPLAVVNAGSSIMALPFIGLVDLGLFFPLVIIPAGIIGATNGYNMLAGYNGLEAGLGAIILSTLGLIAWFSGSGWVAMMSFTMVFALLGFLYFNKVPARVFPGDSLTYSTGAMIACVAILGNMEKYAIMLFIPYLFDALMFVRFRFIDGLKGVEAFAKVGPEGSLSMPNKKIYDFTHLALKVLGKLKRHVYEKDVVFFVLGTESAIAIITFLVWLSEFLAV